MTKIRIVILGASGYTGAELLRWLLNHPHADVVALTGDSQAGKSIGEVYPHLSHAYSHTLISHDAVDYQNIDLVFCCLPHGTTQEILALVPHHVRIVDLSADFRLHNLESYQEWYGHAHRAPQLQRDAVYGLSEIHAQAIRAARIVANPGCYPTSILLSILPLIQASQIEPDRLIIDSMSGVSGAGRKAVQGSLFTEVNEGVKAYGVGGHRHVAEMEQEVSNAAGKELHISFTPHLVPMNRGISSTIHTHVTNGNKAAQLHATLSAFYADAPFVQIMPLGIMPSTHEVRGTNLCRIGVADDRRSGKAIIVSVIDNLVKGASGQAIQNMNLMFGLPEVAGLNAVAVFP